MKGIQIHRLELYLVSLKTILLLLSSVPKGFSPSAMSCSLQKAS